MLVRFKIWLFARLLWLYSNFVAITSKTVWIGREHGQALAREGRSVIYTFWHGRQAMLLYYHKSKPIWILISPSKDGELVSRIASAYGVGSVRGSSRKNPQTGLKGLIRVVRSGGSIAITPDGPLGPARTVKQGALYLAQLLNIPILPLSASYYRKIIFKSWDSFSFPLPFNKIVVGYGAPLMIAKSDDLGEKATELKIVLDELTAKSDGLVSNI